MVLQRFGSLSNSGRMKSRLRLVCAGFIAFALCLLTMLSFIAFNARSSWFYGLSSSELEPTTNDLQFSSNHHAFEKSRIPRIIHQSWKTSQVPNISIADDEYEYNFGQYIQSWSKLNTNWTYMFWTDEDNGHLFRTHPDLQPFRKAFESNRISQISKADFARYAYLYVFGGIYVDLDFECLKPLEDLAEQYPNGFLSPEPELQTMSLYRKKVVVCNAIMASRAGHPFWLAVMQRISQKVTRREFACSRDANYCTGPQMLQSIYTEYKPGDLPLLSSNLFYPEIARYNQNILQNCKRMKQYKCKIPEIPDYNDSFAVHHWSCTWCRSHTLESSAMIEDLVPADQLLRPLADGFIKIN
eukprot:TRINITY_DN6534_c0_g1_i1.p1 TRINITY_DN6534_c0_g1~~TRINITY_DN6534_c0_g1_i1.p1  ORF type:complete len:356 (+),score=77.78 TRINITY_DN6534_c0_g1_i1:795-1862(+)